MNGPAAGQRALGIPLAPVIAEPACAQQQDPGRVGALAALVSLEGLGLRRLRAVLAHHTPMEALDVIMEARPPHHLLAGVFSAKSVDRWRRQLRECPPERWSQRCRAHGIEALTATDASFPDALRVDQFPPAVLFVLGTPGTHERRTVAIVGTRNATMHGRQFAARLGRDLAAEGITVVSGLARGIDAEAHRGALTVPDGAVVGVVGNGLDQPYPRQNASLWAQVAERGAVLSEWPPGTSPDAFRFPLRNRIIAALAEVVVVVESRETGGSLITAVEAAERGITVMAVPGDVRSRSARGTNALIADGASPVTGVDDVLTALSLDTRRQRSTTFDPRPLPRALDVDVLARVRRLPCTLDEIVTELQLPISTAAMAMARLERNGWVYELGGWFEAIDPLLEQS